MGGKKKLINKLKAESRSTNRELKAQMQSSNFWYVAINTCILILFYYTTSIGLTFYQSWLMKELQFPLCIVFMHFIIKFSLAAISRAAYSIHTGQDRVTLGWPHMLGRVGMVAFVASLDIGLSQWSFEYIDVALYTVTKSTSIVFILLWAIILKLEKKHWSLVLIVIMICVGLIMFTYKSTDFVLIGFLMVLAASFLSGIRWTVSQLIMQRTQYGLGNPVDMIYHVQPLMILTLLPFAIAFEGTRVATSISLFRFTSWTKFLQTMALVSVGGCIAFAMEVAEFLLVSYTSGLTLSVAGIVKEILSLTIAIVFQSHEVSVINLIGLVVCMTGISMHVIRKATSVEKEPKIKSSPGSREALLSQSDSSDSEMEIYHTSRTGGRTYSSSPPGGLGLPDDMFRDHRQWTSVRDSHIKSATEPGFDDSSILNQNCDITDDIVDFTPDDKSSNDALDEADKLLEQLDLLSSD